MRVTAIKQQVKNPERASIFLDSKYSFSLSLDELITQKLKVGLEIDDVRLKELQKISADGKLRMRALEWAMGRPHSVKEFRDYLRRKKAEPDHIVKLTDEFLAKRYLDDTRFAKWRADILSRKDKSDRAISFDLRSKGVERDIIREVLEETGNEEVRLRQLLNKLSNKPRYQDKQKLVAYLVGRGFSYSLVKDVLSDG